MNQSVLWVVTTFPTPGRPNRGVHIYEQARHVGALCPLNILAMVPMLPPLPRYRDARQLLSNLPKFEKQRNFKVYYLPVPYVPQWKLGSNIANFSALVGSVITALCRIRKIQLDTALVHAHMGTNSLVGSIIANHYGAPLVTTVHGSDVNYGLNQGFSNSVRRLIVSSGLKRSDIVVGVSQALCRQVQAIGIKESQTVHIPNGFDPSAFFPMTQSKARDKLGLPRNRRIVLFIGNLLPVKGVDLLIKAFQQVRSSEANTVLYCVGEGMEMEKLQRLINNLQLEDQITLVGMRPHDEIPLWMNSCDLLVVPSRNEGWPTVLAEAQACGKSVVATNVGGIREIVTKEFLGEVVEPENPDALAQAIVRRLGQPSTSTAIESHAEQYTWSRIAREVVGVYDRAQLEFG